ncbi:MAG: rhomboid family intramembrane serine protease [Candidatus Heimdallarchaeota archaeon]|nr:rhomboid family intramembrane serine protease [Candidatus Heimdallarchaeota archaeon]
MEKASDFEELKGPTMNLFVINTLFFIITSIMGRQLLSIGTLPLILFSLYFPTLMSGFIWTPFTSIITHSGIAHLGSNMIFLFFYGYKLEEEGYSAKQIYFAYILTGVMSGLLSMFILIENPSVGASGAVFGLLGTYYGTLRRSNDPNKRKVLYTSIILFILASSPNTNIFAHLLGLILGTILGSSDYFQNMNEFTELK